MNIPLPVFMPDPDLRSEEGSGWVGTRWMPTREPLPMPSAFAVAKACEIAFVVLAAIGIFQLVT